MLPTLLATEADLPPSDFSDAWFCGDEAARVRLAARAATPPAVLHRLAHDPSATVRAAVAMNPAFAPDADRRLLADEDERIRILLAGKLAALLPGLSRANQAAALQHVGSVLQALADDGAVRVRTAVAAALARMPEAPRSVVLRLARDSAHPVSDPVLRLCPLLADGDLLDVLADPPHGQAGHSVAARPGLPAAIADRIAATAHSDVVRVLLQNHSAAIQECTLDVLVGRAGACPDWHEPLVRRPALPRGAIMALHSMVTHDLRGVLAARGDFPADLDATPGSGPAKPGTTPATYPIAAIAADALPDGPLLAAIRDGDMARAQALLAAAADVAPSHVEHALALRNGKALVSLAWKAGFSPGATQALVTALGLPASQWEQGFPFSPGEMEWQIELLDRPRTGGDQLPGCGTSSTTAGSPRVTT